MAGSVVRAVGYGVKGEGRGLPARVHMADVVVMDLEACAIEESAGIARFLRVERTVCAVARGFPDRGDTDTCYGDSGGPLFERKRDRSVQFAITSFSTSFCGEKGGRAYYSRLDVYRNAIRNGVRGDGGMWRWRRLD